MSIIPSPLHRILSHLHFTAKLPHTITLPPLVRRYPGASSLASLALVLASWLHTNYREFMALGPGGLPYHAGGWLMALFFKMFSCETLSTKVYDADQDKRSYVDTQGLITRVGPRPNSRFHVAPVRQFNQWPSKDIAKRLEDMVSRIVMMNSSLIVFARSPHEGRHSGVLVHPDLPSAHRNVDVAYREIAHVHPTDHSLHVMLAPQNCKTAIEYGWGERHKMAGSEPMRVLPIPGNKYLPKEYMWIYAPRDEFELAVVERFVVAGVRYMTGLEDVSTVAW